LLRTKKGTFYRKSFIWFLLTATIPGMITGAIIYWYSTAQIEKDLSQLHLNQMEQRVKNIDDQLSYLEMDLSNWAFNSRFGYKLKTLDFVYHFQETWDITQTLNVIAGSHPLIKGVELYIDRDQPVVFRTEYYKVTDPEQIKEYRRLLQDRRLVYWDLILDEESESDAESVLNTADDIRLIHKVPGMITSRFGVLIVRVNSAKLVNLLKTMTPYNEGLTFLMDAGGNVVATDSADGEKDIHQVLRQEILQYKNSHDGEEAGNFLWNWNDKTYSVSYGNIKRIQTDWTYVSASPITAIISPLMTLSRVIIIVSLSVLLLGLLLSWLASNWIYTPVRRLMSKIEDSGTAPHKLDEFEYLESQWSHLTNQQVTLQERLNEQLPNLRNSFLLQLIQGHLYAYSEQDLRKRMERYGWNTDSNRFYILRFQLTGYDNLKGRFGPGDESLVTFMATNIIEEIAASNFGQYVVLNFHDLSVAMFLSSNLDVQEADQIRQFAEEVSQKINQWLKLHVTITVSRAIDQLKQTHEVFMEAERFAGYRRLANQNQLLFIEEMPEEMMTNETSYPFALEQDILQALRSGKLSETERCMNQFMNELAARQDTVIYVQQGMLQLLGSILHAIMQSGVSTFRLFEGENLYEQLSQIREPGNMLKWMKEKVIQPYIEERAARADRQLKEIVEQTVEYIHANYMRDISLDECADRAGTSSYTLSRLFKQITGVNFIDYVTNVRIESAKKQLQDPDKKINEVAANVGYQQRYFNRIFKKQVGVTPGQYREMYLEATSQNKK
jgi:AraC-like DNA-binding protein